MGKVRLSDLRSIRKAMGKSQSEMADLLGISIRAVQSYEQGWRDMPPPVQKLAGLLLAWACRKKGKKSESCWKVRRCRDEQRCNCQAFQLGAGEVCWAVTGDFHQTQKLDCWEAKLARCEKCQVMKGCLSAL